MAFGGTHARLSLNTGDLNASLGADALSWSTTGTYSWTAPAGVTQAYVAVYGGGGGGGGGSWTSQTVDAPNFTESGSHTSPALSAQAFYTLRCSSPSGTVSTSLIVSQVPEYKEL